MKIFSRLLPISTILLLAASAFISSTSQAISGSWWEEYEQIKIESMNKVGLVVLLARLGATEEQLSRNVRFTQDDEFQRRRARNDFFDYVFSEASSNTERNFWIGIENMPALLSRYDFDRGMYSVCPSLRNRYQFEETEQTLFGAKITNAEVRIVWPDRLDSNLGSHNWSCGDAPNRGVIDNFRSSFSGGWIGYSSGLDLPVSDLDVAERLRNMADQGRLFFSFKCIPAAVPLVENLTQGKEGGSFYCHILNLDLASEDGVNIAHWKYNLSSREWEREITLQ